MLAGGCSLWQGPLGRLHLLPMGQQQGLGADPHFRPLQKQLNTMQHRCSSRSLCRLGTRGGVAELGQGTGVTEGRGRCKNWEHGQGLARVCCAICSPLSREHRATGRPCSARLSFSFQLCLRGQAPHPSEPQLCQREAQHQTVST